MGLRGEPVRKHLWGGRWRDKGNVGLSPRRSGASRVCVPAFRVAERPCGAAVGICYEGGSEINMGQSKGSGREAWVLLGWPGRSLCGVHVRVTGRRGLAVARKLSLAPGGFLAVFT